MKGYRIMGSDTEKKKRIREKVFHVIKVLVAGILIYWVMKDIQMKDLAAIPRSHMVLAWCAGFLMVMLQSSFTALRWQILVKAQGIPLTFFKAFSLTFQGMFFSLCLPGGAVGGDVVKAACIVKEAEKDKKVEAVTSIFVDRLAGLIALFGMAFILLLISLPQILHFEKAIQATVFMIGGMCLAGLCAAFFVFFHEWFLRISFISRLVDIPDKLLKGAVRRVFASVDVYRKKWKTLLLACVMGVTVIHPFLLIALYLISVIISGKLLQLLPVFLSSALGNVASCIPGTVGGLGARDKVMQVILEHSGISVSEASVVPILYTCGYVSASLLGALFFILDSFLQKRKFQK